MSESLTPAVSGTVILLDPERRRRAMRSTRRRRLKNDLFKYACIGVASLSLIILLVLMTTIVWQGIERLSWSFLTSPPHPDPARAGIMPALWGTVWVCAACAIATLPVGVAAAIFLEEFQPRRPWVRKVHNFIQLNIANLAGVPSVVYGILGLTTFVTMFGLFGSPNAPVFEWGVNWYDQYAIIDTQTWETRVFVLPAEGPDTEPAPLRDGMTAYRLGAPEDAPPDADPVRREVTLNVIGPDDPMPENPALAARTIRAGEQPTRVPTKAWYYIRIPFGRGVLAGGLTLMLVVLPIVIIASQEALRAVPDSLREGALGMGATRWQVVRRVTLPAAVPGIMTGSIIAMSRAIGEAAPLLMIAGIVFIRTAPQHLMSDFTAMPLQIFNWAGRPQQEFHEIASSGIIVLLTVLLAFNATAVLIRHKLQKPLS